MNTPDNSLRIYSANSDLFPSMMNRMPPPEAPTAQGIYDTGWRPPYPPPFDSNAPDSRRASNSGQTPVPPQGYPVMHDRQLPHLPPDGPYGRPNSHPGPAQSPQESNPAHQNFRPPASGAPHEVSPHSAPPEFRSRMGYQHPEQPGNGDPAGVLPSPSQFVPVPPMSAPTAAQYDPNYYQNPAFGSRQRKAARAQQACDQCRARKAKCDEGRPACSHCKDNSLICVYKEVPPHKQEKSTQALLDRIVQMEEQMNEHYAQVRAGQVELLRLIGNDPHATRDAAQLSRDRPPSQLPPVDPLLRKNATNLMSQPEWQNERTSTRNQKFDPMEPNLDDDLIDDNEGELSIPLDHTTAAHKLLMWPSIKKLLYPKEYDEHYVMKLEEDRGLISVYGQGELSNTADDSQLPSPPWTPGMSDWHDPQMQVTSGGGENGPQSTSTSFVPDDPEVDEFGMLMTNSESVRRYHNSYLEHMHKLHPFLNQNELAWKVESFIRCYCPDSSSSTPGRDGSRGAKRKRSNESLRGARGESQSSVNAASGTSRPRIGIGRNFDNAIILLVLAIGSICECKSPLPGPIMDPKPDFRNEQIPRPLSGSHTANGVLSPANSDSTLMPAASLYALPPQNVAHPFPSATRQNPVRAASASRDGSGQPKNLHVIPGLSFYAYATQILGHLQGANTLPHVHAALLAGLYAGQLAHPFQSHAWISQAARACQVRIRAKSYERLEEGLVLDLYKFAFWTCLQLESDILAELDLPASGISRFEGPIAPPSGQFTLGNADTMMMMYYSAQIYLRKILNRVHTDLYKVEKKGQTRWSSKVQETLSEILDSWRRSLPPEMEWNDNDSPCDEINAARMRAKYYGARYIIHRPLLYHALHYGQAGARVGPSSRDMSVNSPTGTGPARLTQMSSSMARSSYHSTSMVRMSSDLGIPRSAATPFPNGWTPPNATLRELPPKLRRACQTCIEAAIQSTEAFDGIEDRLVVTNIFGTAHAQFGNMLVLSATYMSSLNELVDRSTLERLFIRTIRFLLRCENISPSLRADARILTEIYEKIFGHSPPFLDHR